MRTDLFANPLGILTSAVAFAVLLPSGQAQAGSRALVEFTLEELLLQEIIVTAQKRSESMQDVPVSISAFTAEDLRQRTATSFFDYATAVPTLGFAPAEEGVFGSRSVSLRGIADRNTTAMYIDETPVPDSVDLRVVDVQRVEVLRGPQGSLYGARSMGGALRIVTTPPGEGQELRLRATISDTSGANDQNYQLDATANSSLGEHVSMRAVGFYARDAGIYDRVSKADVMPAFRHEGVAENESYGGSLALQITPSQRWTMTPRILVQRTEADGFPYQDIPVDPTDQQSDVLRPTSFTQQRDFDIAEGGTDRWYLPSLTMSYQGQRGTWVSATSYFNRKYQEREDFTDAYTAFFSWPLLGLPVLPATVTNSVRQRQFTQELRFTSDLEGRINFTVGAFFDKTDTALSIHTDSPGFQQGIAAERAILTDLGVPADAQPPTALADLLISSVRAAALEEKALFGEIAFDVLDDLTLTLGARVFDTRIEGRDRSAGYLVDPSLTVSAFSETFSEDGVSPKLGLKYRATADVLVFANAAKGYRPGGAIESIPGVICGPELAALGLAQEDVRRFESDSLWSYEIGTKTSWLEQRLSVNASAFRIDWEDVQQDINLPVCGFAFRRNQGAARSEGGEVEIVTRPARGLQLVLAAGFVDAKFTEGTPPTTRFAVGDRVPQVPEWTVSFSPSYTIAVGNAGSVMLRADYRYVDGSTSANNAEQESALNPSTGLMQPIRTIPRIRPSYAILDARIAWSRDMYEVALFGKNLTDEQAVLSDSLSLGAETPGRARAMITQPRTVGLEVNRSF